MNNPYQTPDANIHKASGDDHSGVNRADAKRPLQPLALFFLTHVIVVPASVILMVLLITYTGTTKPFIFSVPLNWQAILSDLYHILTYEAYKIPIGSIPLITLFFLYCRLTKRMMTTSMLIVNILHYYFVGAILTGISLTILLLFFINFETIPGLDIVITAIFVGGPCSLLVFWICRYTLRHTVRTKS